MHFGQARQVGNGDPQTIAIVQRSDRRCEADNAGEAEGRLGVKRSPSRLARSRGSKGGNEAYYYWY